MEIRFSDSASFQLDLAEFLKEVFGEIIIGIGLEKIVLSSVREDVV